MITYFNKEGKAMNIDFSGNVIEETPDILLKEALKNLFDDCASNYHYCIGFDVETNGLDPLQNNLLLVTFGTPKNQIVINNNIDIEAALPLNYNDYVFIAHNAKFDYTMLITNKNLVINHLYCTLVVQQRLYQNSGFEFKLNSLRELLLDKVCEVEAETKTFINVRNDTFEPNIKQLIYAADDVVDLIPIYDEQQKMLIEAKMVDYINNVELPLIKILAKCELRGLTIDEEELRNYCFDNETKLYKIQKKLDNFIRKLIKENKNPSVRVTRRELLVDRNRPFDRIRHTYNIFDGISYGKYTTKTCFNNYNSTLQIFKILAKLQLPSPTKDGRVLIPMLNSYNNKLSETIGINSFGDIVTHEGWSKQKNVIQEFVISHVNEPAAHFLNLVSEHAQLLKLVTTYGYGLLDKRDKNTGKLHTLFRQASTANSRLASGGGNKQKNKINIQNIPRDNKLRNCIIAEKGCLIQTVDYSGAEIVIICDKAHDKKLYDLAVKKNDAHSPIITNSWRHIFLFRAGLFAEKWINAKEYFNKYSPYLTKPLTDSRDEHNPIYSNWLLSQEFIVNKEINVPYRQGGKNATFGSIYNMGRKTAAMTYNGTTIELRKKDTEATAVNVTNVEAEIALWAIKQYIPKTFEYMDNTSFTAFLKGKLTLNTKNNTRVWFPAVIKLKKEIATFKKEAFKKFNAEVELVDIKNGTYYLSSNDTFKLDKHDVELIDGQARNLTISGTQADMIKEAMVVIDRLIVKFKLPITLLMQVHDELVYQVPDNINTTILQSFNDSDETGIIWKIDKLSKFIPYVMEQVANRYLTNVQMKADSTIEPFWTK